MAIDFMPSSRLLIQASYSQPALTLTALASNCGAPCNHEGGGGRGAGGEVNITMDVKPSTNMRGIVKS